MAHTVKIASAIAGKAGVTLYVADGQQINLPKNGWKTAAIMNEITKPLAQGKIVEIDLDSYCAHKVVEEKSGGVIKFLKKQVRKVFRGDADQSPETIVAEVDGQRIEGIEAIERHIEHAASSGNTKGIENFIRRMVKIQAKRGHNAQDALIFMKKADLPIAEDGSIIAYKLLYSKHDRELGDHFVDCHTKNVTQWVGSLVRMDESMVDPDRRRSCSNGLHIARRGYLDRFSGNAIVLVKIEPEDVIAVPEYDHDKMRVSAYHILADITADGFVTLKSDLPMTKEPRLANLLGSVLKGDHVGITSRVTIGAAYGGDVVVEMLNERSEWTPALFAQAYSLDESESATVDIKTLRKTAEEERAEAQKAAAQDEAVDPDGDKVDAKERGDLPEHVRDALAYVKSGGSQREAAKKFGVCPKTLRKRINEGY